MTDIILITLYILSIFLSRYFFKLVHKKGVNPDTLAVITCFLPGLNLVISFIGFLVFNDDINITNWFFNIKK